MLSNINILKLLSENFNAELVGKKLRLGFTYRKSELLMTFGRKNLKTLFFNAVKNKSYLYLRDGDFKPKRKQVVELFKNLKGLALLSVKASGLNRELSFDFENNLILKFIFYGYQPNALLLNKEKKIIDSFKISSRLIDRDFDSEFPTLERTHVYNSSDLEKTFRVNPPVNISKALRMAFHDIDKSTADEIAFLAAVPPDLKSHEIEENRFKVLYEAYEKLKKALPETDITIYQSSPPALSLANLKHLSGIPQAAFASANDAVIEFIRLSRSYESFMSKKRETLKPLKLKLKSTGERTKKQKSDLEKLLVRQDWNKTADVLMSNLHQIKKGMTEIVLPDFDGNELVFKLDVNLSPASNAERYYKKAKAARSGEKKLRKAIEEGEKSIRDLIKTIKKLESVTTLVEWDLFEKNSLKNHLPAASSRQPIQRTPSLPYREFNAPKGYTAYVGKSAKDNDKLTFRIGKKNDLWLHVQGAQGSHVVVPALKKGIPFPRDVIVFAAQLAARHSKQKHAGMVPVIYTQCKFVWKKKGGPPGTVYVKNEKSIMVKPRL